MKHSVYTYILFLFLNIITTFLSCSPASAAGEGEDIVALAGHTGLKWVEPGVLSLHFTCPQRLDLGMDDVIRIVPVLTDDSGKRCVFPEVVYMNRPARRFYERRRTFLRRPVCTEPRLLPQKDTSDSLYHYCDTLPVGSFHNPRLEMTYYYSNCCREYVLWRDTLAVPPSEWVLRLPPAPERMTPFSHSPAEKEEGSHIPATGENLKRPEEWEAVHEKE